jgi:hypothetical protein
VNLPKGPWYVGRRPEQRLPFYVSGKVCPDCQSPEWFDDHYPTADTSLAGAVFTYSCPHYQRRLRESPCKYCGKAGTPVRQVSAPVPFSDCYCDDCVEKCRDEYTGRFSAGPPA